MRSLATAARTRGAGSASTSRLETHRSQLRTKLTQCADRVERPALGGQRSGRPGPVAEELEPLRGGEAREEPRERREEVRVRDGGEGSEAREDSRRPAVP